MQYLALIAKVEAEDWLRALVCLLVTAVLVRLSLPLAQRFGLVDRPGGRKDHSCPIPVTGGAGILIGLILVVLASGPHFSLSFLTFSVVAIGLVVIGQLDDLWDISARWRLGAQTLAAVAMMFVAGVMATKLQDVFGFTGANIGMLSVPFTIFIVVGVINALNMVDGVDGLAGSLALVSLGLFFCFAVYAGDISIAGYLLAIIGAVLGFLVWNFRFPWQPRARVFLGNGGSMLLGFAIAWCAVELTQNPTHPVSPVLGPWTIALPLIDCVVLMFRRVLQRRSPFSADRQHMHHLLLDAGFRPTTVVVSMVAVSLVLGIGAGVAIKLGVYRPLLVLLFLMLIAGWFVFTVDHQRAIARLAYLRGMFTGRPATLAAHVEAAGERGDEDLAGEGPSR